MRVHSQSTAQDIRSVRSVAVFDTEGTIVHVHSVVTVEGADETPDEDIERRALELVAERGLERADLQTLPFGPDDVEDGVRYRVDPASRSLEPSGRLGSVRPR